MTSPLIHGYLEDDYLEDPYLGGNVWDFYGMQIQRVITSEKDEGMQVQRVITAEKDEGMQVARTIDATDPLGMQVLRIINSETDLGMQVNRGVLNSKDEGMQVQRIVTSSKAEGMEVSRTIAATASLGMEVSRMIANSVVGRAMEIRLDHSIAHWLISDLGYLAGAYLEDPYLVRGYAAQSGLQVARTIHATDSQGMQVSRTITSAKKMGMEVQRIINDEVDMGMEVNRLFASTLGMQLTVVIYNTDKLRVMYQFASRGAETTGGGNNAWGNPKGTGLNWLASSTMAGDFDASNLNTDIVEQVWRSNGTTSATLFNDSEKNQGAAIDTFAIYNHNFTSSAVITLEASNTSDFASVLEVIGLQVTPINMFYIAPTFPMQQYGFRRIVISDPTNPDGYLQAGTIIFGTSEIFTKEDIVDKITRRNKHFADKVTTEGFTNASNDRALKRIVSIAVESLAYSEGDINILFTVFDEVRTSLKALWIPSPKDPKRFAVFGKLADMPEEQHSVMGPNEADTVSISFTLDESL